MTEIREENCEDAGGKKKNGKKRQKQFKQKAAKNGGSEIGKRREKKDQLPGTRMEVANIFMRPL